MSKIKTAFKLLKTDKAQFRVAAIQRIAKSKISHLIPDKPFLSMQYKAHFGKKINWKNPKSFNEKLQWLKLHNRNREYCFFVDKYEVKQIVAQKTDKKYIIPTFGVWNRFEEIDFEQLPNQFVLKCTHDSGSVVICRDKSTFDIAAAKKKINKKLKSNLFWHGREWFYKHVQPRIIAEQYMEEEGNIGLTDYKFYCFNGEPRFLYVSQGLENHATASISFLTLDWQFAAYERCDFKPLTVLPPKPKKFDLMVELAKKLSAGIDFLRVDLYEIKGEVYFSELTFSPGAGFTKFRDGKHDLEIGDMLTLTLRDNEK